MNTFQLSIALIILAGLFQGTFGLGMKRFRPLAWEAFWVLFTVIGMVAIPVVWSNLVIPDVSEAISATPGRDLAISVILGGVWGIGALMFGLAINYIGLALAYGITMSLAAAVGSLIPLMTIEGHQSGPAVWLVVGSIAVMLLGVAILTWAGVLRDKLQAVSGQVIQGIRRGKGFYIGLLFAVLNGLGAAALNVGFTKAQPAATAATRQGALQRNASLAAWVIVLFGGFLVNLGYSVYLLARNGSHKTFASAGSIKGIIWAVITALLWFAALGGYGQGAALMGRLGPVIGWSMFLGLSLVISSLLGLRDREWEGMKGPVRVLFAGDAVILISVIMLAYANYLAIANQS
ncbi:MAG: L-rhamnose/proton symporter RhaT [Sedimentisphaerales bacterium]|nr:L-rhamnose/proton symporter RhaT [Sedimentisphaerales bacterium]